MSFNISTALRAKYPQPEWALMFEVANSTGGTTRRYADAMAMNLYPSRGHELHGFEFKAHRSDWLSELKKPEKSNAIFQYCDRWWLVVDSLDVIKDDELPVPWGLMVPSGDSLRIKKQAKQLAPKELTRGFISALVRRALEQTIDQNHLNGEYNRGYREAQEKHSVDPRIAVLEKKLKEFDNLHQEFSVTAGMYLSSHNISAFGPLFKIIRNCKNNPEISDYLTRELARSKNLVSTFEEALKQLEEVKAKVDEGEVIQKQEAGK